jgi:hypothetical protein
MKRSDSGMGKEGDKGILEWKKKMRELLKYEGKGARKGRRMMIGQAVKRDRNVVEEREKITMWKE